MPLHIIYKFSIPCVPKHKVPWIIFLQYAFEVTELIKRTHYMEAPILFGGQKKGVYPLDIWPLSIVVEAVSLYDYVSWLSNKLD